MKAPREVRIENQNKTWFVLYLKAAPNRPVAARFAEKQLLHGDGWTRQEVVEWVKGNKKLKLVTE
jgi:hypothetical protein